jgi:hypothetical protein
MSTLGDAADVNRIILTHTRQSRPMALVSLFVSQCAGSHSAAISCTTHRLFFCRWFCVVHDPKPLLHHHNWLSFVKFRYTEFFLIPCPCHVMSWLPPSSETCKYSTVPSTQKNFERFSTYWYAPFCCVCLGCCEANFRSSRESYELPCIYHLFPPTCFSVCYIIFREVTLKLI